MFSKEHDVGVSTKTLMQKKEVKRLREDLASSWPCGEAGVVALLPAKVGGRHGCSAAVTVRGATRRFR